MKAWRRLYGLRSLLVVLFLSYYVGGTAFTHTHRFARFSITHSHPFIPGADGLPHHTHSSSAFSTLEELDQIEMEAAAFFAWAIGWFLIAVFFFGLGAGELFRPQAVCRLRAPPAADIK